MRMIQHVREKFSCRACEAINMQPPAPSHPIARGSPERPIAEKAPSPQQVLLQILQSVAWE